VVEARAWEWDETLYAGSAGHYGIGRMPYPPSLVDAIGKELAAFEADLRRLLRLMAELGISHIVPSSGLCRVSVSFRWRVRALP
jgi:hypothetical protein